MSMIDPDSPDFDDHPYDPYPGSPGDLYDPSDFPPHADGPGHDTRTTQDSVTYPAAKPEGH